MSQTIFAKILARQLPCHRVYEDQHSLAFLDVAPLAPGHTLLIPKEPAAQLDALSDEACGALGTVLPRLCRAIKMASGCEAYNVLQNNGAMAHQAVMHVHFHIIPAFCHAGVGLQWRPQTLSADAAQKMAAAIVNQLGG